MATPYHTPMTIIGAASITITYRHHPPLTHDWFGEIIAKQDIFDVVGCSWFQQKTYIVPIFSKAQGCDGFNFD
jgi:hypothetical protein